MNQFYSPFIKDGKAILSESESLHLKVLRLKVGDKILVVDGLGHQYKGTIRRLHKKASEVDQLELEQSESNQPFMDIAIAPTKSNDRFEWFLEKATELGIRNIYPILTYHSERKVIKVERMQKVILSAMKQSLRLWQPILHDLQSFDRFLQSTDNLPDQKYIAHLKSNTVDFSSNVQSDQPCLVMIGPEGGFSDKEIDASLKKGFNAVKLGDYRYRTETAGILSCAIFN